MSDAVVERCGWRGTHEITKEPRYDACGRPVNNTVTTEPCGGPSSVGYSWGLYELAYAGSYNSDRYIHRLNRPSESYVRITWKNRVRMEPFLSLTIA